MKKLYNIRLSDTQKFAGEIAKQLKGGEILALIGPLGSGKTAFTRALAKSLKVKHNVTSPTFTLMNIFPARLPGSKKPVILYHLDLYRTKNFREVRALGLTEIWGNNDTVTVIEWADKIKKFLPKKSTFIYFENAI